MVEVKTKHFRVFFIPHEDKTPHDEEKYFKGALEFLEELIEAEDWVEYLNKRVLCVETNAENEEVEFQLAWGGPSLSVIVDLGGRIDVVYGDWFYENRARVEYLDESVRPKLTQIIEDMIELRKQELIAEWTRRDY